MIRFREMLTISVMAGSEITEMPGAFGVGDTVVHPHHGAGVVISRRPRRLVGATRSYLEIELAHHSLRIMVPCDCASRLGLRAVMDREQFRRIIEVLEEQTEVVSESWSARQKRLHAMLKSGDCLELAAVLSELATRAAKSAPPATERALYKRSRQVLASELQYVLEVDEARAEAYIDEHVARKPVAVATNRRAPADDEGGGDASPGSNRKGRAIGASEPLAKLVSHVTLA
jgi:CarD family transcriptional regulator